MLNSFKKNAKNYFFRPLFEMVSIDKLSRPSLNNLDEKLENYLDFDSGTYLEVGANDGFKQSNTYYFERLRCWKGILIEPVPFLYELCKKNRPQSEVFNYICSIPDESGKKKIIREANLMSQVKGALDSFENEEKHLQEAMKIQKLETYDEIEIECKTLSEIIDSSDFDYIDFMSIDVEGYEFQVLKGLDLSRHLPKYILVEIWPHEEEKIKHYLGSDYCIESYLTRRDILFKRKV